MKTPKMRCYFSVILYITYGGYPEMAQKVIEGDVDTWSHMHVILRWPKIRTIQFLFNFGSKYQSRVKILRWPTFFSPKTLRWPKIRREIVFEAKMTYFECFLDHLKDPPYDVQVQFYMVSHIGISQTKKWRDNKLQYDRNMMELKLSEIPTN